MTWPGSRPSLAQGRYAASSRGLTTRWRRRPRRVSRRVAVRSVTSEVRPRMAPRRMCGVPGEAAAVRQAAEWVLSGWSLANIAAELRKRGLRGAHGGKITPSAVRSMITAPTSAGHRVYRGQIVARGNWEPILAEETWQACRLKLSQPRLVRRADGKGTYPIGERHRGNPIGRRYLLTGGLAVCGVCEHRMVGAVKQIRKRRVPYLSCHPQAGGRGCTGILLDNA
ncbi:MAG: hypothetical protein GEV00_15365, partial [Actinophytocola sp.]|nr:hypothetical protein [Actinophytocola sp.]